jgi:pyridoxine 5-phosphate synthase
VAGALERVQEVTALLQQNGIKVSLFIDPEPKQVQASAEVGADYIELHTGAYANCWPAEAKMLEELEKLDLAAEMAGEIGLRVNAGHGLNYLNVGPVAAIQEIEELNIGHSIISKAVIVGLTEAVRRMKEAMRAGREAAHQHQPEED